MVSVPTVPKCEDLDVFNTLGLDPNLITINSFKALEDFLCRASIYLHPDKLRGAAPPPHTDLNCMNGLMAALREKPALQTIMIGQTNRHGRQGWHGTFLIAQPPQQQPQQQAPVKSQPVAFGASTAPATPFDRPRRPYASTPGERFYTVPSWSSDSQSLSYINEPYFQSFPDIY